MWDNYWGADNGGNFGWLSDGISGPPIDIGEVGVVEVTAEQPRQQETCGVNPVTGKPGIPEHPVKNPRANLRPGGLGNLRPGDGGAGGFRERSGPKHDAIDIVAPIGTPILANRNGTVVFAGDVRGYGNTVVISHSGGIYTQYSHLSKISVSVKDDISEGAVLGKAGVDGNASGLKNKTKEQHVHFGVSTSIIPGGRSKNWKNPLTYLNSACPK
jgi:murein DD-endopeptidase MepM/ murein hydrolase activator NlpD